PKYRRFGQVGLTELIPKLAALWKTKKDELIRSAEKASLALNPSAPDNQKEEFNKSLLHSAFRRLEESFDEQNGGFNRAPKFPTPHNLLYLLRYWKRTGKSRALNMVKKTLSSLRHGGIYDQIGYGFHRYATDSRWIVPHFEKMLYDQALLILAYTEAYQVTKDREFRDTAEETILYVLRDMTSPEGAFYSAEDADSEGEEGKFYTWSWEEIHALLEPDEEEMAVQMYSIRKEGNYREEATQLRCGRNILYLAQNRGAAADKLKLSLKEYSEREKTIQHKLFAAREKREHPLKDDKILTDWNGLIAAALAKASQAFNVPDYAEAAERAVEFILTTMYDSGEGLFHRHRDRDTSILAYADDYAFLIWGLIELYQTSFKTKHLERALRLQEEFIAHFWDTKDGGFFFTSDKGEKLLVRKKEIYDGAIPSSNSVAFLNLIRLARLTADTDLEKKALRMGGPFAQKIHRIPAAYTFFLCSLDFALGPSNEVVVVGQRDSDDTRHMLNQLMAEFLPNKAVVFLSSDEDDPILKQIAPYAAQYKSLQGQATAYVCRDYACHQPTTDVDHMLALLKTKPDT
ncbi:MAG: thioredoxin domain-containing protein, partial [Candidatus Aminicenantes bacterium]